MVKIFWRVNLSPLKWIIYCVLMLSVLSSCKRQSLCKLESETISSRIEFNINWSESNIDIDNINNVSIYAYSKSEDQPYTKISGDISSAYIDLPEGSYSILIFNDFVGDIAGVNFNNADSYELFYAEMIGRSSSNDFFYELQSDEVMAQTIGSMAVWKMEDFEVSEDMLSCSCCGVADDTVTQTILEATPTPSTTRCVVSLGVDNLNNAAYIEAIIRGLASGVYLSSSNRFLNSDSAPLYGLELGERTYNNSDNIDGVATGETNTFGKVDDDSLNYEVVIDVILSSGEMVTFTRDVTDQILEQDNTEIFIDLTSEDDKITLPEGSASAGFGVLDWGESEKIELL
ncbi:MAG: DUF5119 domain-containing protein [Rikenellaceae bacterium]